MSPPLSEGAVDYQDGTKATVEQQAHDLVNFLQWAAEPEMEERKGMGIHVLLFLGAMTCFFDTQTAFSTPKPAAISSTFSCGRTIRLL